MKNLNFSWYMYDAYKVLFCTVNIFHFRFVSVGPRLSSFLIDLNEDDINMADCSTMLPVRTDQTLQICGYPLRDVPQNLLDRLPPHVVFNEYGVQVCLLRITRKLAFCICENKGADQLRGNSAVDRNLCFQYKDSTIPLLMCDF